MPRAPWSRPKPKERSYWRPPSWRVHFHPIYTMRRSDIQGCSVRPFRLQVRKPEPDSLRVSVRGHLQIRVKRLAPLGIFNFLAPEPLHNQLAGGFSTANAHEHSGKSVVGPAALRTTPSSTAQPPKPRVPERVLQGCRLLVSLRPLSATAGGCSRQQELSSTECGAFRVAPKPP